MLSQKNQQIKLIYKVVKVGRVVGSLGLGLQTFQVKVFQGCLETSPSGDGQTLSISASSNGIFTRTII